jgi:hypothetical protein
VLFCQILDFLTSLKIEQRLNLKCLVKLEKKNPTKLKVRSMLWKIPTSSRMNKSKNEQVADESMVIVFFNVRGVIIIEWIPKGQMFN